MQWAGNAPSLLLMMAAVLMMLRCVVRRLLSPHLLVCSYRGPTALMWAASEGHESIVRLLLEYRANVNVGDR
jgi:ankyrin repeat protein